MKRTEIKRKTPLKAKAPMKKSSRPKMTAIRKSAQGQPCMVQVPHICNGNPETVVLAHLNGGGMGCKNPDWMGAWSCSACHSFLDGEYVKYGVTRDERDLLHYRAIMATLEQLVDQGLVRVAA